MLYCSQCGAANEAGLSLCARCGAPLSAVVREPAPAPDAARPVESPRADGGGRPPRRSRLPLWIALGAALAILAALLVLPRLLGGSQDPTQAAMEEIYSAAAPYQRQDGTVAPEDADAAIEAVYLSARSSNLVLSCHRDDYGVVIEVEEGPVYVYCPEIVEPDPEVILDPLLPGPVPLDPTVLDPSQPADPNTAPAQPDTPDTPGEPAAQSPSVPRQEGSGALRIITLQPFESSMRALAEQNGLPHDLDAPALVAWETVNRDPALWRFAEDDKRSDGDVDMEALLHLDQYQVILWHGLGGYTESTGYFLCTSIPWSEALAERYGLTEDNCCRTMDGCVALRPAFFAQHYGEGAFYNAFIYLATSYSGKDPEMARVFLDRGAAVVFVATDDVERTYDLQMLHLVSESYLAGTEGCKTKPALDKQLRDYGVPEAEPWTIRSSLELAQITYGDQDPYLSRGARVIYYCRPGMESLPYEDWVALFDRSRGEILSPDAELTAQINRAATRFWEVWYRNDYDPATVEWMDLLEYGFSKAEREGCASYGEYFYVPLEELNRCVIRAFNLRLEPEQGVSYYPDPNNAHWYYRLEGDQVCRPGAGGEIPTKFHRLESAFRQPDGTIHLVFTRYAINTDVVWASGEVGSGLQPEEYAALSPEDFAPRLTRNEATVLGSAHMLVAPRSDAPAGIEDYYIQRCWFEPSAQTAEPAEPSSPAAPSGERSDLDGEYTVQIKEVLDGGAALRVSIMEPVIWDRDYVMSLRVGDPVTVLGQTYYVRETPPAGQLGYYFLENGPYLSLTAEGDCLLCWSGEEAVMEPVEELILPVSPDFSVEIFRYGEMGSESLSLQRLEERYGPDLLSYNIRLTVVNGIAIAGSILLFY